MILQTGIILAGGSSSRMGQDKSLLYSNVSRLAKEMKLAGCSNILVMCGSEERAELFDEECVVDSAETLAESLLIVISELEGMIQLAPCDAYLADADLFSKISGVPVDDNGIRQPLLAKFDSALELNHSNRLSEIFKDIPSCEGGLKARNVNTPSELKEIQSYLQK